MPPCSRPRFYLFVNGILTSTEDRHSWTDRAVTWTESHYGCLADRYEYFSDVLTRRLFQAGRVRDCAARLAQYRSVDRIVVGHSNGADIACRLLQQDGEPGLQLAALHLIAAAAEADFEKNGLNHALLTGRLGHIHLYGSRNDGALRLAQATQVLGFLGLGYGSLGRTGPRNVDPRIADRVTVTWRDDFGHSTWFAPGEFARTITAVVEAEAGNETEPAR
ncbi:MAG TPA: hypothetical protein VIM58_02305 [Candidatus Methylacidiphilales bacterium]